jgi:hypothetical protein
MRTPKLFIILCLLALQLSLDAQVKWYQSQDVNNPHSSATVANTIDQFKDNTFPACYLLRKTDFGNIKYYSRYFRSFAVQFYCKHCYSNGCVVSETGNDEMQTDKTSEEADPVSLTSQLVIYPNPVQDQLTVSNINPAEYNKLLIYNMQGAQLQQQALNASISRIDINNLTDGVYLLVLHSSVSLKEKAIKFVVRK